MSRGKQFSYSFTTVHYQYYSWARFPITNFRNKIFPLEVCHSFKMLSYNNKHMYGMHAVAIKSWNIYICIYMMYVTQQCIMLPLSRQCLSITNSNTPIQFSENVSTNNEYFYVLVLQPLHYFLLWIVSLKCSTTTYSSSHKWSPT